MRRIAIANPVFNGKEKEYLNECIDTGWISSNGRFIQEFEEKFAKYCGVKYALAAANGTVTLHLILLAMGIGAGDEVIMPTLTYIATANAVRYCGGKPIFIDSDPKTWNLDVNAIEAKITSKTKAIIVVHLYGLPADMEAILKIASEYNLMVIEDAAEAHGALYHGKRVGSLGDAGSFSFFGNKIITCGEGGMVTTNNAVLYEKMRVLRSQGVDPQKKYWHSLVGYNYRMTNMQAAVGLAQLENIEWHLNQRKRVADIYKKYLCDMVDLVEIQKVPEDVSHVYWMNSVILNNSRINRDEIMRRMEESGIEMRPLFYPMHIMPPYNHDKVVAPIAEGLSKNGINLPTHAQLDEEDIDYIICSLKGIIS